MLAPIRSLVLVCAGLALVPAATLTPAAAQNAETYSAEDVIAHFRESVDLGGTRSLCIGTPSECGEVEAAPEPAPFNLRVQFELNSAQLTADAQRQLDAFASAATSDTLARAYFNIDGHTDALGGEQLNQSLSERRATSVVDYLVAKGVAPDKLVAKGHGETQPITDDPYEGVNRRVEASLAGLR